MCITWKLVVHPLCVFGDDRFVVRANLVTLCAYYPSQFKFCLNLRNIVNTLFTKNNTSTWLETEVKSKTS